MDRRCHVKSRGREGTKLSGDPQEAKVNFRAEAAQPRPEGRMRRRLGRKLGAGMEEGGVQKGGGEGPEEPQDKRKRNCGLRGLCFC